jgi:hypothetical protein
MKENGVSTASSMKENMKALSITGEKRQRGIMMASRKIEIESEN